VTIVDCGLIHSIRDPAFIAMIIAITGSSGLVGTALVTALAADGHLVRRLVRRDVRDSEREIRWDPAGGTIDAAELEGVDAVVNLAGENVASHRWTAAFKERLRDSRVPGTRLLATTLAGLSARPDVLVSASAVGYYGARGDEWLAETSAAGSGFLAEMCQEWERATQPAADAGIRVVHLRIGVVLSPRGGALAKLLPPFKLGVGGVIGSGRQYMSWITLDDLVSAIRLAVTHGKIAGPVNAVSPAPATNRQFTKTLGRVLGRPTLLPMPAFAARLVLGEMADEMLLVGQRVEPRVLKQVAFSFQHPQLEPALHELLRK
jgi:uncharacterized protein (TIGR01777 family)